MKVENFKLHRQGLKYYVVPVRMPENLVLPYPNNFLSSYFKSKASRIMREMEKVFSAGYHERVTEEYFRSLAMQKKEE